MDLYYNKFSWATKARSKPSNFAEAVESEEGFFGWALSLSSNASEGGKSLPGMMKSKEFCLLATTHPHLITDFIGHCGHNGFIWENYAKDMLDQGEYRGLEAMSRTLLSSRFEKVRSKELNMELPWKENFLQQILQRAITKLDNRALALYSKLHRQVRIEPQEEAVSIYGLLSKHLRNLVPQWMENGQKAEEYLNRARESKILEELEQLNPYFVNDKKLIMAMIEAANHDREKRIDLRGEVLRKIEVSKLSKIVEQGERHNHGTDNRGSPRKTL